MNGEAGKGDLYRPVNQQKYAENYEAIFRKDSNDVRKESSGGSVRLHPRKHGGMQERRTEGGRTRGEA